jgi:hypothetical protein
MDCIDLKERFGRRHRVRYEESYRADRGRGRTRDPWLMILACRYGHILPWGGNLLAASVDGHPNIAGRLRTLSCCTVVQDGDFGELTVTFDVADFQTVARIMRPRCRRQISDKEKAEMVKRLQAARDVAREGPIDGQQTARERDDGPKRDSEPTRNQRALFAL